MIEMSRSFSVAASFNIISMVSNGCTLLVSTIMSGLLIKSLIHSGDTSLLLFANNYIGIFGFALVLLIDNIHMLKDDYGIFVGEETLGCRIQGYILYAFLSAVMNAFGLQGIFRLCRVVYSTTSWAQKRSTYIIFLFILLIVSFLLILPLHIWFDIKLMPEENVCLATTKSARGLIWCTTGVYSLPMFVINSVYLKLTQHLRRTPIIVSSRAKRDVVVIHRVVLVSIILLIIGTPTIVLMLMFPFTKVGEPLFYRISSMKMAISMTTLSLILIYTSPQLKEIITYSTKKKQVPNIVIYNKSNQVATLTKK